MDAAGPFSADYFEARARFLEAAGAAGARLVSHANPAPGPGGRSLSCDVARLGDARARRWLVVNSATHGVEGFVGSAAEIDACRRPLALGANVGVLLIHAINPHGFAWLRRVNEDNVDINRNHIDHAGGHPRNDWYDRIADALVPEDWTGPGREAADRRLAEFTAAEGPHAIPLACSGQYDHPHGIFYGGRAPVWSNRVISEIARSQLAGAELVAYVDFHTGLGPYGVGEAICYHAPGEPAYDFALAAYGEAMTSPHLGTSASPLNRGKTGYGLAMALPGAVVSCITLEFGTYDGEFVLNTIRADAWAARHAAPESAAYRQVKADIRRAFYPDQEDWRRMTLSRGREVIDQALERLAAA
ncbi:MAG: DUF2817 domain-containing protein [Alphaproteobacteria bacterium]|nr:DUF2817 domain-containing protein [Alphaproteobacteria bacterium]